MSANPPPLDLLGAIVAKLYPWLAGVRLAADGAGLIFRTAAERLHLEGEPGDPAAARKDDGVGYFYVVTVLGSVAGVYWSPKNGSASTWAAVVSGPTPPVDGVTSGTPIRITGGSARVTIG